MLGPCPSLAGVFTQVSARLRSPKPSSFSSPFFLAEDFLPFDSSSSLSLEEKDFLSLSEFPLSVSMSLRQFSTFDKRLSGALTCMSILSSLFCGMVMQLGHQPEGKTEADFEFARILTRFSWVSRWVL